MTKTLVRWHIGDPPRIGWRILEESIRQIQNLYPEFDCMVCKNGPERNEFFEAAFSNKSLQLVRQDSKHANGFFNFSAEDWKLCPPRMRVGAHEIIIDNDVVITERLPSLENFLSSNQPLCLEASAANQWIRKSYGQFNEKIPDGVKINSGLYGFPPGFDFRQKLLDLWGGMEKDWSSRYDEKGSVAAVIGCEDHILIPITEVLPLGQGAEFRKGPAYHFLNANRGKSKAWEGYQLSRVLFL